MITAEVWGLPELAQRLEPTRFKAAARRGLLIGLIGLQTYIVVGKLSGQVLNVRTGTLRRSVRYEIKDDDSDQVTGLVGSFPGYLTPDGKGYAGAYARILNYGGTFNVPAHTRRLGYNKYSDRVQLLTKGGAVRKGVDTVSETMVRAHTMTVAPHNFLESSISERWASILGDVKGQLAAEAKK